MKTVKVFPGPCAFEARITAQQKEKYEIDIEVESACPAVKKLAAELTTISMKDLVGKGGFGRTRPFEIASRTLAHTTCPVLTGILKAAEAEMGMAVSRDVTIEFEKEET